MQRQNLILEIEQNIQDFQEILKTENNKIVLEEKTLEILWEIEAKVSQIISDKNWRNALKKEEVFQRYLRLNKIESQYKSIDDFLDMLISKLSQELTQRKIKLKFDLFEKGNFQTESNRKSQEKIEIKTSQKNKIFLRVLHKIWIDFSDVKQFEEKLNPERMRKVPYQIYHIISENIQKTVLISDQIGQATFAYDKIISPEIFQIIEKWEEIEGNKALKIIYNKKSYEKNLEIALGSKLTFEEKNKQIVNEEEEKADESIIKKVTKIQLQEMWKNKEISKEKLSSRKWKNFAENWNKEYSKKYNYTLPTSINWLISILWWDVNVALSLDYIISLLEWKEFINIPSIKKHQLQEMWKNKAVTKENLSNDKWKKYAENWNKEYSEKYNYTLPVSIPWLIWTLWWNVKVSLSSDYIISLLEWIEFINIPSIKKHQLQEMWKKKEISKENLSRLKWKTFAENWNDDYSKKYNYTLPTSIKWLIWILWWDKKISTSSDYVISLLEWKEFISIQKLPSITKLQLQEMWKNKAISKENLKNHKWRNFAANWNKEYSKKYNYILPTSISWLIWILWWNVKVSLSSDYVISLLQWKEFIDIPSIKKHQLQEMWNNGEIYKENLKNHKWRNFAANWNKEYSKKYNYILPTSIWWLIWILWWETKTSQSSDYIISLLEWKEFISIQKLPSISKHQLQEMWKKKEISKENLSKDKWKDFAENWNKKYSKKYNYTLPTSIDWLIWILWWDKKISTKSDYVISLLEWKEFIK